MVVAPTSATENCGVGIGGSGGEGVIAGYNEDVSPVQKHRVLKQHSESTNAHQRGAGFGGGP
jgi:hypothetical protein